MVPTNAAAAAGAAWYNFFLIQHGVPHGIEFGLWKRKRRQGRTLKHVTAVTVATKRTHSSPRGATTGEGLCDHSSVQERLPPRRRAPRRRGGEAPRPQHLWRSSLARPSLPGSLLLGLAEADGARHCGSFLPPLTKHWRPPRGGICLASRVCRML